MRKCTLLITTFIFGCATSVLQAQGSFQNLDFESANIPPSTSAGTFVPISEALPGWSAYFTSGEVTQPQTQVVYDGISTGGNGISVVDLQVFALFAPVQGNYAAILFGGAGQGGVLYSASISQMGTIPNGTESLFMDARSFGGSPIVAIDGTTISMMPVETFGNYTLYGGDISSYTGGDDTLSFTAPAPTTESPTEFFVDDITFSPEAVPEPNAVELLLMDGIALGLHGWRKRGKSKRA